MCWLKSTVSPVSCGAHWAFLPVHLSPFFNKKTHFFVKFLPHLRHVQLCSSLNRYGRNRVRQTWQTEKNATTSTLFPIPCSKIILLAAGKGAPVMFLSLFQSFGRIDLLLLPSYYYYCCYCCSVAVVIKIQKIFNRKITTMMWNNFNQK